MVSPHLPPDQTANALLPVLIAGELRKEGAETSFLAHPPAADHTVEFPGRVVRVPRRSRGAVGRSPLGALLAAAQTMRRAWPLVRGADLVHLHSNGLIVEAAAWVARRLRKPWVITLYGTDVWHHDPRRARRFGSVVRGASHRAFYSRALLEFAQTHGLAPEPSSVVYPAVPSGFHPASEADRAALRAELGLEGSPILLTVKRLHPVGGHTDLVAAAPAILARHPAAEFVLVGEGGERAALEAQAREAGVARRVRFLGVVDNRAVWKHYAAADLFVLPSRLESWGAVMLEALACGTPVAAARTAGATEVQSLFSEDVRLFERENPDSLAEVVCASLAHPRRVSDRSIQQVRDRFSPRACASQYLSVYRRVLSGRN